MIINTLSIIIPIFNEENTIYNLLESINSVKLLNDIGKEIVLVNDGSTDNSDSVITKFRVDYPNVTIIYINLNENIGKGNAIHVGIQKASGDYLVIQDADLEYDPNEFNILLKPILKGVADVVYGSRFVGSNPHRILFFWHSIGNKFLTSLSNIFTNINLTDMETCYKMFDSSMIKSLQLKEKRFGFEPEVTAKISRIPKVRIYEVGISYFGRTYSEGKKIGWRDGFEAIYCILKYNLWSK